MAQSTIPTNIYTANRIFTNTILMTDKHNIPKRKMHSNFRLLPEDIVCKIIQRNHIRRANTCDPDVMHGLSSRAPPHTLNMFITFNNEMATKPNHIESCFYKQFTNTVGHNTQDKQIH